MSKQENFNDILRSKFTERETPVNEEDWRKMRKTIDDSRNRKKRIIWLACSMLGLLIGAGIYEYITLKNTPESIVQVNSKAQPTITNTPNGTKNANSNNREITAPAAKIEKENIKGTVSSSSTQANSAVYDKTISQHSITSVNQVKKSSEKSEPLSAKTQKQLQARTNTAKSSKPDKIASAGSETSMNLTSNTYIPAKSKYASSGNKIVSARADNNSTATSSVTVNKNPDSIRNQIASEPVNNPPANTQYTQVNKKPDSIVKSPAITEVTKNGIPPSKSDSTNKKADSIPPKAASEMVSPLPPIEGKVPSKNSFSIEAGAGYSLGWNYGDTVQGRGFNATIGFGYTRTLSSKFALKTGIQLSSLSGMGTSPFIIKHINYDFGYNANDTSLKTNWLFYLTIPLQVEYKLDEKDAIGLGGTLSYLVTGYGQLSASSMNGDVSKTTNTYSQFMYVKGFNQWNSSVFLLYKRTLFGKLSAYIIPYFGLMDIKSNSFFSQNKLERDSGLKLLLSYSIL